MNYCLARELGWRKVSAGHWSHPDHGHLELAAKPTRDPFWSGIRLWLHRTNEGRPGRLYDTLTEGMQQLGGES